MRKGQYYRLFLGTAANPTKAIAAAKTMSLHGSLATEESSTKDTTGDALEYEGTSQSYDISGTGLTLAAGDPLLTNGNNLNDLMGYLSDTPLFWRICLCSGANNRSIDEVICSGQGKLTQLNPTGQNGQTAQFSYTLTGFGAITVEAESGD